MEENGLKEEGIYRVNGNARVIERLKDEFDKGVCVCVCVCVCIDAIITSTYYGHALHTYIQHYSTVL